MEEMNEMMEGDVRLDGARSGKIGLRGSLRWPKALTSGGIAVQGSKMQPVLTIIGPA
jgi:hypothetical protein